MSFDQFLVTYNVRAPNLMWLLGAGASAASGIPTAHHLIWQFKRTLFCAAQRISLKNLEDLSDPVTQQRLKRYFDGLGHFPPEDSPEEYAAYFEAAYPHPNDRRTIIEKYVLNGTPSYGHMALGSLLATGSAQIVWTTNFDKLLEDAAVRILGSTSRLVVASLDTANVARDAINAGRWPIICKLHGDFQSSRLKNTVEELRSQDADMRRVLIDSCKRFGLVIVGYSGRDESILHALEEAIDDGRGFPNGLFWLHHTGSPILPAAAQLVRRAQEAGIQARFVEVHTFDEVLGDIIKQREALPPDIAAKLDEHRSIITDVPVPESTGGWPVVRLNALPVSKYPTLCRLVVCEIGGTSAVKEALASSKANAVAVRRKQGVLAFGADSELRKAFGASATLDTQSIEPKRLHYESSELGLLRDAFAVALARNRPLIVRRQRIAHLCLIDHERASSTDLEGLKRITGQISGVVPRTTVRWEESLYLKLSYHLGRMWCLIEPSVRIDLQDDTDDMSRDAAKDFVRERLASRYNRHWNALLDAWSALLVGSESEVTLKAFTEDDGADAMFCIQRITGFSRRSYSR
jgi:NAD-dependent SIR2 family protein deacetylase